MKRYHSSDICIKCKCKVTEEEKSKYTIFKGAPEEFVFCEKCYQDSKENGVPAVLITIS